MFPWKTSFILQKYMKDRIISLQLFAKNNLLYFFWRNKCMMLKPFQLVFMDGEKYAVNTFKIYFCFITDP